MSYDFRLVLPPPGRTAEEILAVESGSGAPRSPSAANEERKTRVAGALRQFDQRLEEFRFPDPEDDADEENSARHIELDGPPDGPSIQVMIFDEEAAVTLAYGHDGEAARAAFSTITEYLRIMRREGGYLVHDPQLGRVIDPDHGLEESLASYLGTNERLAEFTQSTPTRILPLTLKRAGYFLRWVVLVALTGALFYGVTKATLNTRFEPAVFLPLIAGFSVKVVFLDPARLRDIGWSPRLTFLSIFPPAALVLQFLLFVMA